LALHALNDRNKRNSFQNINENLNLNVQEKNEVKELAFSCCIVMWLKSNFAIVDNRYIGLLLKSRVFFTIYK